MPENTKGIFLGENKETLLNDENPGLQVGLPAATRQSHPVKARTGGDETGVRYRGVEG
jgi:hypothetical protein